MWYSDINTFKDVVVEMTKEERLRFDNNLAAKNKASIVASINKKNKEMQERQLRAKQRVEGKAFAKGVGARQEAHRDNIMKDMTYSEKQKFRKDTGGRYGNLRSATHRTLGEVLHGEDVTPKTRWSKGDAPTTKFTPSKKVVLKKDSDNHGKKKVTIPMVNKKG